jgi:hypothetical protein
LLQGFYYDAFYEGLTLNEKEDFEKIQAQANKAVKVSTATTNLLVIQSWFHLMPIYTQSLSSNIQLVRCVLSFVTG